MDEENVCTSCNDIFNCSIIFCTSCLAKRDAARDEALVPVLAISFYALYRAARRNSGAGQFTPYKEVKKAFELEVRHAIKIARANESKKGQ